MKLEFKIQDFQTAAVEAVVNCFDGQPKRDITSYRIDAGVRLTRPDQQLDLPAPHHSGLPNAEILLNSVQLLENIQSVQRSHNIPPSPTMIESKAAPQDAPNLDVEMETGTGKTYVYIKTIMELQRQYGWTKFIVVVPSVAIREGVKKSFDITVEHFQQHYGTKPRSFIYNSSRLHELERFSADDGVQVMIINIQAFNSRSKDNRRIYEELDDFQSRRPIDVISANRPIVIIDEPQKIGADRSLGALSRFNALMVLRYSATHRVEHNKVYRLDALDAYNQKLVKKIAVRGITVKGLKNKLAYMYLDAIEIAKGAKPRARVEIETLTKAGIKRGIRRLDSGADLYGASGGNNAYRGLRIIDVDAGRDVIELSNGDMVGAGQLADPDVTEESKRRIQIREVIRSHIDKERELFSQGIKVLSLFFIDEVAKYRDYARKDTRGDYAHIFEEEYDAARQEVLQEAGLDEATKSYQMYLQRDDVSAVHRGYFSVDRKTKRLVDPEATKRGQGEGQSSDPDAYDLILKDKERLLSLVEPVRFIFSHSALREGWDNPNVFTLGMLKRSDSTVSRRQEIGRGLRLAVDQRGKRTDHEDTVHDINELTVVTDESYTDFVKGLQQEIAESLPARLREATPKFFAGNTLQPSDGSGDQVTITLDQANQLQHWLTMNEFIDYENHLTQKWRNRAPSDMPMMPAGLDKFKNQVEALIDLLRGFPQPTNGRKPKRIPLNEENFNRKEFQELWRRINHKAVYRVEFDSAELIDKCIRAIDTHLRVAATQYVVQTGEQRADLEASDLAEGTGFEVGSTITNTETAAASSQVEYDLLGEIAEKTQLTRRTVSTVLRCVEADTFAKYRQSPEQFIAEAARLINEQKATAIVEHLIYDTLVKRHDTAIFTENQTRQDFAKASSKLQKHIYDYVVTDSDVERDFVTELDTSNEVVVYAKLPRGFFIPTPVGNYNPDWAIAFQEGTVKHVYFVAETKGSLSSMQLTGAEVAKIECARKFFTSLNAENVHAVKYDVVTDYSQLMSLVSQP